MTDIGLMVRSANPVPDDSQVLTDDELGSVLLLAKQRSTDMDVKEKPNLESRRRSKRTGWVVAAGAFVAAIAAIGSLALLSNRSVTEQPPVTSPTTTQPSVTTADAAAAAEALSKEFLDARAASDVQGAVALLSPAASIATGPAGDVASLPLEMAWVDAFQLSVEPTECTATEPGAVTDPVSVTCLADVVGPRSHSETLPVVFTFAFTSSDGVITEASLVDNGGFEPRIWDPFVLWLQQSRPDAVDQMFADPASAEVLLTDDSVAMWDQFTTEYVNEWVYSDAFSTVTSFLDARHRNVMAEAQDLLAADAVLDWGPGTTPELLPLGRGWEDATGIEFEPRTCVVLDASLDGENGDVVDIRCSVFVTAAIASALGDSGAIDCVDFTVDGALITSAALSAHRGPDCPGFSIAGRVFDPFQAWLEKAHPELAFDDLFERLYSGEIVGGDLDQWRALTDEFVAAQRSD